jgi:hypothetical protein
MFAASPASIRTCQRPNAAPTWVWPPMPRWRTFGNWGSPPCACCRCTSSWTKSAWCTWAWSTTGATTRSAFSVRPAAMRRNPMAATPATSSGRWWPGCTPPASKCCSTWCSTTPQKPTCWGRHSVGAAWTTPLGTGCRPNGATTTSTGPAAATRWTSTIRAACNWCWTVCATGCSTCTWTASASTWRRCWAAKPPISARAPRFSTPCSKTRCWPA